MTVKPKCHYCDKQALRKPKEWQIIGLQGSSMPEGTRGALAAFKRVRKKLEEIEKSDPVAK